MPAVRRCDTRLSREGKWLVEKRKLKCWVGAGRVLGPERIQDKDGTVAVTLSTKARARHH